MKGWGRLEGVCVLSWRGAVIGGCCWSMWMGDYEAGNVRKGAVRIQSLPTLEFPGGPSIIYSPHFPVCFPPSQPCFVLSCAPYQQLCA